MLQFLAVGADEICTHQFWFVICFPIDVAAFQELNAERQGLAWGAINESGYLYIRIPGISGRRFPGFVVVVCRIFQKEVDQKLRWEKLAGFRLVRMVSFPIAIEKLSHIRRQGRL
ncbi:MULTISPECIES: hypothetical protein [unclassified Pseudomonas]|uniref:hypothetical protein n=1 Tax=unclassified Pseudomonas TaxID=196821 RepID=UPI0007130E7A|nr:MULTISPECIES: hypothetical protein [unclassified Pseudomonas]KRB69772.1 hypothetical protein ASD95_25910 [Pseudomonas sp. Root71]